MHVFDRVHFDAMTAGDRALQLEVLGLFRDTVSSVRAAFSDDGRWRDAVHTLKGSARGIGFSALAEACEQAEAGGEADLAAALARVEARLDEALVAVDQFTAAAP